MSILDWISRDGKLLLTARIVRTFSYGFLSIILAIYLKLVGFDEILIGIVLSATLANSVIFNLFASFYADRFGRKKILIVYAILMAISGAIFLLTNNYVALIVSALIGTINVTGTEVGAFLSIEQAILPQAVKDIKKRNTIFAVYNMAGTFAMSAGVLLSGLPQFIQKLYGLNQVESIRFLFLLYSICAVGVVGIYFFLSKKIELEVKDTKTIPVRNISPKSKGIIVRLSSLFAVDSFAGGFVIQSIVSFWFFSKFGADLITLSYIFSIAGVLTAFSFL